MNDAPKAAAPTQATGGQIARGAAWMVLFKLLDKSIGVASTLVLARLLMPADFGLVAMAMSVVAFTQLMSAFGFDTALIQRQDARREHFDTAWTFNVLFGTAVALTLCALAWPMARFYGDARLPAVLVALAFSALILGFENIGVVAFRKQLDFRSEFRFLLSKRVAGFVITVSTAVALKSYWALVIGIVATRVISVAISYRMHPYRPRFSLAARRELMHFSRWIFFSSLIGFVGTRSTDFVLGRTVGAHGLGVYTVASEVASMPSTELIAPLNRAVYPAYASLSRDPVALRSRFLEVFGIICLIAVPACFWLFAAADAAVRVVLGHKWLETVPLIRLLGLCGLLSALQSNMYLVNIAVGKPQANTLVSLVAIAVSLPVMVAASLAYGTVGAAYGLLLQATIGFVGIVTTFRRNTEVPLSALLHVFWRPFVAALTMASAMWVLDGMIRAVRPDAILLRLLLVGGLGVSVYAMILWGIWAACGAPTGAESTALRAVTKVLGAARSRLRPA